MEKRIFQYDLAAADKHTNLMQSLDRQQQRGYKQDFYRENLYNSMITIVCPYCHTTFMGYSNSSAGHYNCDCGRSFRV